MAVRFVVLSSGSRGNSTLIQGGGPGLLLDLGLGPRVIADRLASVGSSWDRIGLALLTHTHGDHVNSDTLGRMASRNIPLYCHTEHERGLAKLAGYRAIEAAGLVRFYDEGPFLTAGGYRVEPLRMAHGPAVTYGFRVETRGQGESRWVKIGYVADSGCWTPRLAEALADVDLLGVEFNHDVAMQWESGRHPITIARNVGDQGHLSNEQGAALLRAVIERSGRSGPRHVVLLHISSQCNRPQLAVNAARTALRAAGRRATIHATQQCATHPDLLLTPARRRKVASPAADAPVGFPWELDGGLVEAEPAPNR